MLPIFRGIKRGILAWIGTYLVPVPSQELPLGPAPQSITK